MNRRLFLQIPVLTLTSTLITKAQGQSDDRPNKGFKVEARKDRFQEELHIMGGQFNLLVSAKDTGGDFCAYDTIRSEKGGPTLHIHHNQDEWFYIIKGEFIVQVGVDRFNLRTGDSAFAPRTIPHAFAKISEGEAQMLVLFQPAGSMEDFFEQVSKFGSSIPKDQERLFKDLWGTHGMEVVGPPLKF
jgi:mannose-6-phosphate isomerase-like protein (cupin superfamily)